MEVDREKEGWVEVDGLGKVDWVEEVDREKEG